MKQSRTIATFLFALVLASVFVQAEQSSANPSSVNAFSEKLFQDLRWRMIGPFRGGRTRAAVGVPNQPNVCYIGVVNGGVWKSDDYGRTWNPIFDQQPTQSVGSIAIAPSDPNIIYVGSGEGLHRPDLSVGDGIYKSIDSGKTWNHLGLRDAQQIPALAVDPHDPTRLFAAVLGHPYGANEERGVFRSVDGGQSWQKVLYKDGNTGASDVEVDPSNPNIVYASLWEAREGPWEDNNVFNGTGGGLFKSTDGGTTWRALQNGLPKNVTEINITIAPSQPSRLYAVVGTNEKGEYGSGKGLGFFRSDDSGGNWYATTTDPRPALRIGGGDLAMPKVDPKNPDIVYSASIVTVRSTDGGKTWTGIRGAPGGDDYQNLWINPENPNIILLVSDQGAIVTVNGGQTWSSWFNQPTAQLYHAAVTNTFPYKVCGGQQESGSVCISSRGNDGEINFRDWHPVGVIEYGYVAPDPSDPDIIFGAGRNEVSKFHWSTGQVENVTPIPVRGKFRAERTEPIVFSTLDPHTMYYAANFIFKTVDGGQSWETISPDLTRKQPEVPASVGLLKNPKIEQQRGAVYALATSFKDINTLWAGTDDGLIWITRDGGKKWDDITPPQLTAWSKVTQISASHFDDETAYASVSRFRVDDLHPYIYRTRDGGKNWQLITAGLPNSPVDTVRTDTVAQNLLFAGTETGVWVSFDTGDHWQPLQLNLPRTSARDLWVHDDDLIVATHGRSFWILDDITPLRQLTKSVAESSAFLFQPAVAYRVRRDTNTDTPIPPDEPHAQNPPDGVILDYFLGKPASGPVGFQIMVGENALFRRYSSADKPDVTEDSLTKQLIPLYWIRPFKSLSTDAGMHRWVWDMRLPPPTVTKHEYPIAAVPGDTPRSPLGPLAPPGKYIARLSVNGRCYSAPFEVKMDPRVKASAEAIQQQFAQQMHLSEMLTRSSQAVLQARTIQNQLKDLSSRNSSGSLKDSLDAATHSLGGILEKAPETDSAAPQRALEPLNNDIATLYGILNAADGQPSKAALEAIGTADNELLTRMKEWEQFKTVELPELNRKLRAASTSEIRLDSTMLPDDGGMDINEE